MFSAESFGLFVRLFVDVFVCLFVIMITSERLNRMMKLDGRCVVKKSLKFIFQGYGL